jgi:hypothetical protein
LRQWCQGCSYWFWLIIFLLTSYVYSLRFVTLSTHNQPKYMYMPQKTNTQHTHSHFPHVNVTRYTYSTPMSYEGLVHIRICLTTDQTSEANRGARGFSCSCSFYIYTHALYVFVCAICIYMLLGVGVRVDSYQQQQLLQLMTFVRSLLTIDIKKITLPVLNYRLFSVAVAVLLFLHNIYTFKNFKQTQTQFLSSEYYKRQTKV